MNARRGSIDDGTNVLGGWTILTIWNTIGAKLSTKRRLKVCH